MHLFRRWAHSGLATIFVLALPLAQAQAEDCVQFSGMKHCAVGGARLVVQGGELTAQASGTSGRDGVAIDTLGAKAWSAGQTCEPSGQAEDKTVTAYQADGKVVATSTVTDRRDGQTIAASFVDASGNPTTYSALVFSQGRLVAGVSGLASGSVAAMSRHAGQRPTCTHLTPKACRALCVGGPLDCAYCDIPCRKGVENDITLMSNGKVPHLSMSFQSPFNGITLGDVAMALPVSAVGDTLVLIADAPSAGASQDVDQVQVTSTAKTVSLTNESATPR